MSSPNAIHERLVNLFSGKGARFRVVSHEPEGRTDVISRLRGNQPSQAAKAMVLKIKRSKADQRYVLAVVPGDRKVDMKAVKAVCGGDASFAAPDVAAELTGCAMGAVPPVSFHPDLKVVMDVKFLNESDIVFNAGLLDKSIFIDRADFLGLTQPEMASISLRIDP